MITEDTVTVETSEPGFVKVRYVQLDDGIDMGGRLCFEQASVSTVIEILSRCLNIHDQAQIERRCGNDSFRVYGSGHEQRPFYNILNRRPDAAPNGGLTGLMMTGSATEDLLKQLSALTAKMSGSTAKIESEPIDPTAALNARLLEAAGNGDSNAVGEALKSGANVNARDRYKQSALNIAAENGHLDAVAILLAAGADLENTDVADKTPLMAAAFAGQIKVVELLLRHGAVINRDLLNTLSLKADIFEENAEAGMVPQGTAEAWRKFFNFMVEEWHKQNKRVAS
jgi:hypothetical protein